VVVYQLMLVLISVGECLIMLKSKSGYTGWLYKCNMTSEGVFLFTSKYSKLIFKFKFLCDVMKIYYAY